MTDKGLEITKDEEYLSAFSGEVKADVEKYFDKYKHLSFEEVVVERAKYNDVDADGMSHDDMCKYLALVMIWKARLGTKEENMGDMFKTETESFLSLSEDADMLVSTT